MKIGETVDRKHYLRLNDVPTFFEENSSESVRARSFVSWKLLDRSTDLLLGEWGPKIRKVTGRRRDASPVEVLGARGALPNGFSEVALNNVFLVIMARDPTIIVLKTVDEVLSSSVVDSKVKETSICIPFFERLNSRALSFPCPLKNRQGHNLSLEILSQIPFAHRECPMLLSDVEMEDDLKGHVKLDFVVRENGPAPLAKTLTRSLKLVEKHLIGLRVAGFLSPGILDDLLEVGHFNPEVFKPETFGPFWPLVASQEERAMVRERGRESMENVCAKIEVPILIAEKRV